MFYCEVLNVREFNYNYDMRYILLTGNVSSFGQTAHA